MLYVSSVKCDLLRKNKLNWIILCDSCLIVFLFAGWCEVSGYLSIVFGFLCQLCSHVDRPKTMADGPLGSASASPGSDKSDETQGILKSM